IRIHERYSALDGSALATSSGIVRTSTPNAVLSAPVSVALLEGMPHERVDPTLVPNIGHPLAAFLPGFRGDASVRVAGGKYVRQVLSHYRLWYADICRRNHRDRRYRARAGVQTAGQYHLGAFWRFHNTGGEICRTANGSEAQSLGRQ